MANESPLLRYKRKADWPLMRGDHLDGLRSIGFAYVREAPRGRGTDRLLVEGDEDLPEPPERLVPRRRSGAVVRPTGCLPIDALNDRDVHPAEEIRSGLGEELCEAISADTPERVAFIDALLAKAEADGHLVWLVGGAVRDVITGKAGDGLKDLDFVGTVLIGELWEWVDDHALAVRTDSSDFRWRTSGGGVWSVRDRVNRRAFLEYKPLALGGFRFAACGGDLKEDTATRDLTVNCLYFDRVRGLVLDPTRTGLEDLVGVKRRLATPNQSSIPMEQAKVVLRVLKFVLRWQREGVDFDDIEVRAWVARLPGDLPERLNEGAVKGLRQACEAYRESSTKEEFRAAARDLGPTAERLITVLYSEATS